MSKQDANTQTESQNELRTSARRPQRSTNYSEAATRGFTEGTSHFNVDFNQTPTSFYRRPDWQPSVPSSDARQIFQLPKTKRSTLRLSEDPTLLRTRDSPEQSHPEPSPSPSPERSSPSPSAIDLFFLGLKEEEEEEKAELYSQQLEVEERKSELERLSQRSSLSSRMLRRIHRQAIEQRSSPSEVSAQGEEQKSAQPTFDSSSQTPSDRMSKIKARI